MAEGIWIDLYRNLKRRRWGPYAIALGIAVVSLFAVWNSLPDNVKERWLVGPTSNPASDTLPSVGWIYIGTRIDDAWRSSSADGVQPAKTINVDALPVRGGTYEIIEGVYLRAAPPVQQVDGQRPVMAARIRTIDPGAYVAIDDLKYVGVAGGEARTWVWAHVTVIDDE